MNYIVADTNILISADIVPGSNPDKVVWSAIERKNTKAIITPSVLAEYQLVVRYTKFIRYRFPPQWLNIFINNALLIDDPPPWSLPLPDPTDGIFLAAAHATGAWLITGNLKHYPRSSRFGVKVKTPAQYIQQLGERS